MIVRSSILAFGLCVLSACQTTTSEHGVAKSRADDAVGLTFMSQVLLAVGAGGFAALPLLIAADLHAANAAMIDANNEATIQDTYKYVYKRDLNSVGSSGSTGMMFRDLKSATRHFRTALDGHGVARSQDFVLTAVRTADTKGYTLYALVHRPQTQIRVRTVNGGTRILTAADEAFYRPYQTDAGGNLVDVVVDWAAVPRSHISNQKGQAILLTLGANSVMVNRRSDEFWRAKQRWLAGGYNQVVAERQSQIANREG